MDVKRYIPIKTVKQIMGWGRWKIERLMENGTLAYLQEADGGRILIDRLSLDSYIESITHNNQRKEG